MKGAMNEGNGIMLFLLLQIGFTQKRMRELTRT